MNKGPKKPDSIEKLWVKRKDRPPPEKLVQVSDLEWECARKLGVKAKEKFSKNKNGVLKFFQGALGMDEVSLLKISREELKEAFPDHADDINHSFMIIPDDSDKGFRLGVLARAKTYTVPGPKGDKSGIEVHEGILGHGAFGLCKILMWENGETDAIKIEAAKQEDKATEERAILKAVGQLRGEGVRKRPKQTSWIKGKTIKDKQYSILSLHPGEELEDYLQSLDYETNVQQSLEIALRSTAAIAGLHKQNILHLDIKPANFMIDWQGNTAIVAPIDFGFSAQLKPNQKTYSAYPKGTPLYFAPEINHGWLNSEKVDYSKGTDVYALGKMFLIDLHLRQVSGESKALVEAMLDEDPNKRPSAETVFKKLKNITLEETISTRLNKKAISTQWKMNKKVQDKTAEAIEHWMVAAHQKQSPLYEAASEIIILLKENQMRHEKTWFATASHLNHKTLQELPKLLKDEVCKALDIDPQSKFLEKDSWSNRKAVARAIKAYDPETLLQPEKPKADKKTPKPK